MCDDGVNGTVPPGATLGSQGHFQLTEHVHVKFRATKNMPKGHLARAGDRLASLYVLQKGIIARERLYEDGTRQIVGFHVPGDTCGLDALVDGRVHYDLRALCPIAFVTVDRKEVLSATRTSDVVSTAIRMELTRELAIAGEWITNIGIRPANQRIAHLACQLAARQPVALEDIKDGFKWPGTQADLAAAVGLSVVHVSRTLKDLAKAQLYSRGKGAIFHALPRLRAVAAFDDAFLAFDGERLGAILLGRNSKATSNHPRRKSLSVGVSVPGCEEERRPAMPAV